MKKILLKILKKLAKDYLLRNKIEVIAITGSAGKTTTKVALGHIYKDDSSVFVPTLGYNTESGVPLAIFDLKSPKNPKNPISWVFIVIKVYLRSLGKPIYKTIVLEYGADAPGDIDYLVDLASPHIGVITTILPVHIEGFVNIKNICKEKSKIFSKMTEDDFAIMNFDNKYIKEMANNTKAKIISYGSEITDSIYLKDILARETGLSGDLVWQDNLEHFRTKVIATQLTPSIIGAVGVALARNGDIKEILKALEDFYPEKGRVNLLEGLHDSVIIDDSYNSNPESARAALEVLELFKNKRKIAVLGSMNELGGYAKVGHEEVAMKALMCADIIVTVGDLSGKFIYPKALEKKDNTRCYKFDDFIGAGVFLKGFIKENDVILFKGSQNGVLLEEAIKYIMKEPERAQDLLVRQTPMWQQKKSLIKKGK
ncbi:MAG: UDP-N-acetylmuramoyl-tripeptide--D-alanyl-D-alanine ligase [bacterium]